MQTILAYLRGTSEAVFLGQRREGRGARANSTGAHAGSQTYGLLKSLTSPTKASTMTFHAIDKALGDRLATNPLVIVERFRFHKRNQGPNETISSYVAVLRRITQHCQFGTHSDEAMRDRFVCGLRSRQIQKRTITVRIRPHVQKSG